MSAKLLAATALVSGALLLHGGAAYAAPFMNATLSLDRDVQLVRSGGGGAAAAEAEEEEEGAMSVAAEEGAAPMSVEAAAAVEQLTLGAAAASAAVPMAVESRPAATCRPDISQAVA